MTNQHEPDSTYLEHLRWQVATEARRRARFGTAAPHRAQTERKPPRWKAAALLIAGLSLGTAGTVAAGELSRRQDRAVLLTEVEIELQLATTELSLLASERERMQTLMKTGIVSKSELGAAELQLVEAVSNLDSLELKRAEVRLGGAAPDRRLTAPLVSGRDFVLESMVIVQAPLMRRLDLLSAELERIVLRSKAGFASQREVQEQQMRVAVGVADIERLTGRKALRSRYLQDELTALQTTLAARLIDARTERSKLRHQLVYAAAVAERQAELYASGRAGPDRSAELELARLEAKLELAELRLKGILREAQGLPKDLLSENSVAEPSAPAHEGSTEEDKVRRR